jgi:hypothetical protein
VNQALKQFFLPNWFQWNWKTGKGLWITKAIETALNGKNQKQLSSGPCRMMPLNFPGNIPIPTTVPSRKAAALFLR